jgi:hypothetical protein
MESLLKFLGLNNTFNQVDLYVSGIYNPIGKGIEYDKYILTLEHITNNINVYTKHKNITEYKSIFKIEEYDIDILCDINVDGNIDIFLDKLKIFNTKYISIHDINDNYDMIYKVYKSNLTLKYNTFECIELKSTIFPQIPIVKCNINTNDLNELGGLSGSIVYNDDKIMGILTSDYEKNIEIIPFEFIIDIINLTNKYCRRYCPLQINNNIVLKQNKSLKKNDMIITIDNKDIDEFGRIYYDKYDTYIPIKTYILLKNNKYIDINICRYINKIKKYYNVRYLIDKFNEANITINFRENNKQINIKNFMIKELSEEFISKTYKKICEINDDIYSNKKILYIYNINNNDYNNIDLENNIYILRKISGHNINNIHQIKKYTTQTHSVLELKAPDNTIIKLRI